MKDGFIYFLRCGLLVKIGYSANPVARIRALTKTPRIPESTVPGVDLRNPECIGIIRGTQVTEREAHVLFGQDRWFGEWFMWNERMEKEIRALPLEPVIIRIPRVGHYAPCSLDAPDQMRPPASGFWLPCESHPTHFCPGRVTPQVARVARAQWTVTYA